MKQLILALAVLAAVAAKADGTAFFTNVTNLWYLGHKSNVLAIAEERLARNTNDIAGLILKVEYDLEFTNLGIISNSIEHAISAINCISNDYYTNHGTGLTASLQVLLDDIATDPIPDSELDAEMAKSILPGKRLLFERRLKELCLDGLVTNYPALNP